MMLVLQIAAGIVLALLVLAYFRQIVGIALILLLVSAVALGGWALYEFVPWSTLSFGKALEGVQIILILALVVGVYLGAIKGGTALVNKAAEKTPKSMRIPWFDRETGLGLVLYFGLFGWPAFLVLESYLENGVISDTEQAMLAAPIGVGSLVILFLTVKRYKYYKGQKKAANLVGDNDDKATLKDL